MMADIRTADLLVAFSILIVAISGIIMYSIYISHVYEQYANVHIIGCESIPEYPGGSIQCYQPEAIKYACMTSSGGVYCYVTMNNMMNDMGMSVLNGMQVMLPVGIVDAGSDSVNDTITVFRVKSPYELAVGIPSSANPRVWSYQYEWG